jgi:serine/threonine-protein kinase HipA
MAEKLYIHADLGDGTIALAGQLIVDDKLGRFKYAKAYINHPQAFALDPVNLPLNEDIQAKHRTRDTPAMFGVLLDAGPDEWGRRWLTKTRQPPPVTQVEFLLAASGEGVGALHFTPNLEDPVRPPPERPFESLVHLQHGPRIGTLLLPRQRRRWRATQVTGRTRWPRLDRQVQPRF